MGKTDIFASFIYSSPSVVNIFDENTLEYRKEKTIIKNIIPFNIDLANHVFLIFSNTTTSRRLLTEFSKITNFEIPFEDIIFEPSDILRKFEIQKNPLKISSLRIRNFKVKEDIIGTFSIKILEPTTASTLLQQFGGEVIYLSGSVEIENRNVNLGFYENGTLTVTDQEEFQDETIDQLKSILFSKEM